MRMLTLKMMLSALAAMFLAPAVSSAQQGYGRGDYWGPHMMWGGGWMGGGFMIIFWVFVIIAIYLGIKWAMKSVNSDSRPRSEGALDVLKRRYAAGEITREQYLEMKTEIEG